MTNETTPLPEPKKWYESTTILLAIAVAAVGLIPEFGNVLISLGVDPKVTGAIASGATAVLGLAASIILAVKRITADIYTPPAQIK